jgi:hypothetical protein
MLHMYSRFRVYTSCMTRGLCLPLTRSPQEQEAIEYPSSCYVIGRSGTGKTTTMLFKMLSIQHTWQQYSDVMPKPRQVFVTQSPFLAKRVGEYFERLMLSLETGACSLEEPRTMQEGVEQEDVEQEFDLVDPDNNKQLRLDLPEKYSGLLDKHFPLFITYDQVRTLSSSNYPSSLFHEQLCTMLQKDIGSGNHNDGFIIPQMPTLGDEVTSPTSPTSPRKSRLRARSGIRTNLISYDDFFPSYWDHLPQALKRGLGEKRRLLCMPFHDNQCSRSCLDFWGIHGSDQGVRRYDRDKTSMPRSGILQVTQCPKSSNFFP